MEKKEEWAGLYYLLLQASTTIVEVLVRVEVKIGEEDFGKGHEEKVN